MQAQVCFSTILLQKWILQLYDFEKINEAFEESKKGLSLGI